jgi:DNA-binding HxlR family transcriptional regulator
MPAPRPGDRVRGSRSGRPIMAALDLLGRRWALRVLWELRDGALPFRALREAATTSRPRCSTRASPSCAKQVSS